MSYIIEPTFPISGRSARTADFCELRLTSQTQLAMKGSPECCVAEVYTAGRRSHALYGSWRPEQLVVQM